MSASCRKAGVLTEHEVLAGASVGLIPLAIGVGFLLIDYHLPKRDLSRFGLEVGPGELQDR